MDTSSYTTNDLVLLDQFNLWRYGEYERPAERNEVLRSLKFHPYNRSHFEIWRKAEEFFKKAESKAAKAFYHDLAVRHKDRYIFES